MIPIKPAWSRLVSFAAGVLLLAGGGGAGAAVSYTASAVPFTFIDISSSGTVIASLTNVDDVSTSVSIGFNFGFFGNAHSSVFVSSNGLLTFGGADTSFNNTNLTTVGPIGAAIAPYWDDLHTSGGQAGSNVFAQTIGTPGHESLIIQWNQVSYFSGGVAGDTLTFQAILFEDSGNIGFNYLDLVSGAAAGNNGASATVGIKDAGSQGPDRLLLAFNNGPNAFVGTGQSTLIMRSDTSVPEPGALALAGIGLAGLAGSRRRRR